MPLHRRESLVSLSRYISQARLSVKTHSGASFVFCTVQRLDFTRLDDLTNRANFDLLEPDSLWLSHKIHVIKVLSKKMKNIGPELQESSKNIKIGPIAKKLRDFKVGV